MNPERKKYFYYSDPISYGEIQAFSHSKSTITYSKPSDFYWNTLCMPLGHNIVKPFNTMIDKGVIRLVRATDLTGCFRMIQTKNADFTLVRREVALHTINREYGNHHSFFRSIPGYKHTISEHLTINKKSKDAKQIITLFNSYLKEIKVSNQIKLEHQPL